MISGKSDFAHDPIARTSIPDISQLSEHSSKHFTWFLSLCESVPALPSEFIVAAVQSAPLSFFRRCRRHDSYLSLSSPRVERVRHARVWLARKVVRLKRVEVGLTSRVSELAERLATAEDSRSVSTVLSEVRNSSLSWVHRLAPTRAQ